MALFLWTLRDLDASTARQVGIVYGMCFGLETIYSFSCIYRQGTAPHLPDGSLLRPASSVAMTKGMKPLWRIVIVATCAVGIEWLRGDAWYLRFPWYTAPHAFATEPFLIAPVRWLGVYGFSLVLWLIVAAGVF